MAEQHDEAQAPDPGRRELLRDGAALAAGALLFPGAAGAGTGRRALADYLRHDATGLAGLVRRKQASAAELLEIAIARAEAVDPRINALAQRHYEFARAALKTLDPAAPLAGVPFLLKDLNTYLAGTVTSNGSRFFADRVAEADSTLVARYRAAGLVIFGKTTTPEMGATATTESRLHGATRNPWNTEYSSGGSSGGASAAVAAGILPAAHATDGGGSVRIPAALCGLVGLKPTRLRTPNGPNRTEGWAGLSCAHVVSRSVRDSALLLDLTQGAEPGAAYWPPVPARPYVEEIAREPGKLRIGLQRRSPFGTPVDPECLAALEAAARLCASLGHELHELEPPADGPAVGALFGVLMPVGMAAAFRARAKELGRDPGPEDIEPVNFAGYQAAQKIGAIDFETARQAAHAFGFRAEAALQGLDVVLSPTTARATWKTGVIHLDQDPAQFMRNVAGASDFTMPFNLSGQPAISLPLHTGANGLPVGVMFGARYGDEATLLRLAAQIERAAPWFDRVSPLLAEALA